MGLSVRENEGKECPGSASCQELYRYSDLSKVFLDCSCKKHRFWAKKTRNPAKYPNRICSWRSLNCYDGNQLETRGKKVRCPKNLKRGKEDSAAQFLPKTYM